MKSNMLKSFTKNLGYKVLAVIFAFTLWLIVYNIDDPVKARTLILNVNVTNASYLENLNKYYEVIEGTNKVSITVKAPRSMWEELDETDFSAVANLNNINIDETGTRGTVPIEITCKETSDKINVTATNKICKIALENLKSQQFVISAEAIGTVAEGHALGRVEVTTPSSIKVSGPESLVKSIAGIVATIDVDGMYMTYKDDVVPILYDAEGKEIDTTRLSLSDSVVWVQAEILKIKEVPISVKPEGTPANGYVVTAITSSPTTVEIKGSSSILNAATAIEIPSELISVEGAKDDVKATIDITDYLPEGTELVDGDRSAVEIVVSVEAVKNKTFNVLTKDIIVTGLSDELQLTYTTDDVTIMLSGLEEDIKKLSERSFTLSVDAEGLTAGSHQVKLNVDVDDTKYTYTEMNISIIISEKVTDTEDTETNEPTVE